MSNLCFYPDGCQGTQKQFLRKVLTYVCINQVKRFLGGQMHFLSVSPDIASWRPFWTFPDEEGKEGGKRTATCKTCITQIHIFTESVLQRGKDMNLCLRVHHLIYWYIMPKVRSIIKAVGMPVTENTGPSVLLRLFCAGQLVNVRRKENQFLSYT